MLVAESLDWLHVLHFGIQALLSVATLFVIWRAMRLIRYTESEWARHHRRRTPLATINGMVKLLRADPNMSSDQIEKIHAVIEDESKRALELFDAESEDRERTRNGSNEVERSPTKPVDA